MSGVICHYGKVKSNGLLASGRIAKLLATRYGFALVDTPEAAAGHAGKAYDYCLVVSSASGFAPPALREGVGELAARAKRYIFVQNDYMTEPAGQIGTWHKQINKPHRRMVWSTIPSRLQAERAAPESTYVNWNMLTYQPITRIAPARLGLFYYGAHRRERVDYFKRWLGGCDYPVAVSTSTRVFSKWRDTLPNTELLPQMENCIAQMHMLGQVGLYAEDTHSHKHYCSPANRFYEMLSAGVPMLFDRSTQGTWERAGYGRQMRAYMPGLDGVVAPLVQSTLEHWQQTAHDQKTLWARDYRADLEEQICKAEQKVGLQPVTT